MTRWAWAEVSSSAIEHNVRALRQLVAPSQLWAVVKADGYGHGSVLAARAALAGGADGLCVALVGYALTLLNSGFDEITNPRLQLERFWRVHLIRRGATPGRSTPVVREHA